MTPNERRCTVSDRFGRTRRSSTVISMAPQGTQQLAVPIGYHTPTTRTAGAEDVQSPCLIHLRDQAEEWPRNSTRSRCGYMRPFGGVFPLRRTQAATGRAILRTSHHVAHESYSVTVGLQVNPFALHSEDVSRRNCAPWPTGVQGR